MSVKFILISYFILSGYLAQSQDLFGIPMSERDSVFIFFLEEDGRYYSYKLGTIDGVGSVKYKIRMQFGQELCFTNGYTSPDSYIFNCSFDDLKDREIKEYWYLYENYMDEDMEELVWLLIQEPASLFQEKHCHY